MSGKMKVIEKSKHALKVLLKLEPPITRGLFDIASLPALLGTSQPTILEIGCNDGTETNKFLQLFGRGTKLYAFDPEPRAIKRFREQVTDPRVQLFELAISDRDGTTEFYMSDGAPAEPGLANICPDGWDQSGSIRKPKEHLKQFPWCKFENKIIIATKTLDTWCREHQVDNIDFMWVDVQGAEVDLIRGAQSALQRTRFLYTEYSNKEAYEGQINLRQLLRLLPDFEVVHRYVCDVLLRNKNLP
jgi:2-O-methyltransferase